MLQGITNSYQALAILCLHDIVQTGRFI